MSEVRTVSSLALLYAFRMLGLFMVLPVLMLYGDYYEGSNAFLLGLALGIYGLTQACFQIPLGLLSDIVGRKPVIIAGLVIFAVGSVVAAVSQSVEGLIIGRALQGSGAIASAIMAMVADLTSEQNRTKAMAAIGASIGLSFTLAMVLGPAIAGQFGLVGVFGLSAVLSLIGIFIVLVLVPTPSRIRSNRDVITAPAMLVKTIGNFQLLRLNWGIFTLHAVLMACFVCIPILLNRTLNLSVEDHWQFYMPVLVLAFIAMLPFMVIAERKQKIKPVFVSAIALMGFCVLTLSMSGSSSVALVGTVFLFFVAFNLLESMLPSLVSKISPAGSKGTAMGLYSTSQFLGAFLGGVIGGALLEYYSMAEVFEFCAALLAIWGVFAITMKPPRHLTSVCYPVDAALDAQDVLNVEGVEDAYIVEQESLLYLKVDKSRLDTSQLEKFTVSS